MKMKDLALMYALAGAMGGGMMGGPRTSVSEEMDIKRKAQKRAATLSKHWNGPKPLHKYTINGVEIEATDKLTARKIYNRKHAN